MCEKSPSVTNGNRERGVLPHNDHAAKSSIRTGCEHEVKKKGEKLYGSRDVLVVDRYNE